MKSYSLSHLSDQTLTRALASSLTQERTATAVVLAHIAEFDARRLYLPEGYPSMREYCVSELHFSEDAAYKRIQAARAARKFPAFLGALAEGQLHLSAVCLLAPHLTPQNAGELLAAAAHKTSAEVRQLIADWFPQLDMPAQMVPIVPTPAAQLAARPVGASEGQLAPEQVDELFQPSVESSVPGRIPFDLRPEVAPIAPERFRLQVTIDQETQEMLGYAQDLLGHTLPSGDLAQVLKQSVRALIEKLERRKFAATTRPRRGRASTNPRHIPAHVRRAVRKRDKGQCTFVSETGHRCTARKFLEFDHVEEVARGGRATVGNIRLRCRAHNQYEAERTFGAEFMRQKREKAQRAEEARRREREVQKQRRAAAAQARAAAEELITPLRLLGFSADEARHAAEECEAIPDAPLEQRLRLALGCLRPRALPCAATESRSACHGT